MLLDDVEQVSNQEPEYLTQAARQHRVDTAKVRRVTEQEFAVKQAKAEAKQNKAKPKAEAPAEKSTTVKKAVAVKKGVTRKKSA